MNTTSLQSYTIESNATDVLPNSLEQRVFYDARIRLLLVNWCRHSVEPRALKCPFKQSNLVARSLLS